MRCRMDITGCKIWNDNNNAYATRPPSVDLQLFRNGELYKTATVNSGGTGRYRFNCLPVRVNSEYYRYNIAEPAVPNYKTTVAGYTVTNTLIEFTLTGTKIWADNNNQNGNRPTSVTINLLQNGVPLDSVDLATPANEQSVAAFSFTNVPFADANGKAYVYTVVEDPVEHYNTAISGFTITNSPGAQPPPN